ncbi:MAG: thiamine pyrophosphate-dependent enzyme [Microbacteriaceae bacterium]
MTSVEATLLPRPTPVQLIDSSGTPHPDPDYAVPPADVLREGYRNLVFGRRLNDVCGALVRQGRLAVYPSSRGQEASQAAAGMVLGHDDWLFPTYRDVVAVAVKGVSTAETIGLLHGNWHSGYDSRAERVATQSTPLATQLLHAVGFAYAAKHRGEDTVVLAMCGDGATSEGDFHEALNFAAVFKVPVVFFVQNNGYAISVPIARQTAAPGLAYKGIGYGIPGEQVDGNDFAAVYAVLKTAIARARSGDGPSLVEALTYRIEAHTNADDDTRYRDSAEVAEWVARDPVDRMRQYLTVQGILDEQTEADITAGAEHIADQLRESANLDDIPNPLDLFAHVYSEPTPQLLEQSRVLERDLARELEGHHG